MLASPDRKKEEKLLRGMLEEVSIHGALVVLPPRDRTSGACLCTHIFPAHSLAYPSRLQRSHGDHLEPIHALRTSLATTTSANSRCSGYCAGTYFYTTLNDPHLIHLALPPSPPSNPLSIQSDPRSPSPSPSSPACGVTDPVPNPLATPINS
jgi:hypothetical protein